MTVYELMAKLGAAGIKLWVEEGQRKFKAPKGALTPDLKQNLVENKQAVIDFLNESSLDANSEANQIPQVDRINLFRFPKPSNDCGLLSSSHRAAVLFIFLRRCI